MGKIRRWHNLPSKGQPAAYEPFLNEHGMSQREISWQESLAFYHEKSKFALINSFDDDHNS
ncbi:MAG: hypothetical protein R2830_19020 [Saprospiraceae bacterium]